MRNDFNTPHPDRSAVPDSRTDEAMGWCVRKDRGLSPEESRALLAWLEADPENAGAFAQASESWDDLDRMRTVMPLTAEADEVIARAGARGVRRKIRLAVFATLSAAALLALAFRGLDSRESAADVVSRAPLSGERYQVQESTAQRRVLTDGSVVELNGDSRIEVDFTPQERRVRLVAGEAHFTVAKDAVHPFLVTAHGVTVRAVGTAFNVRLATSSVEVLVTEGKILLHGAPVVDALPAAELESSSLVAGQRAVVNMTGPAGTVAIGCVGALEIDQALAWQSTRLVFDRTSLQEVVAAFNRYNVRQLVLGSPQLRKRSLSGVFRADNLDGLVRLLQVTSDVTATVRSERETVLFAKD